MITYIHQYLIKQLQLFKKTNTNLRIHSILVSISSGQDSICLIRIIEEIKQILNYELKIQYIYIDHQWKDNSQKQVEHIINYLNCYKNHLYIYQIKTICNNETDARNQRYNIILNHAVQKKHNIIITGHNLTDKIETFIQNLLKGTTIDGATNLITCKYTSNDLILWRPLLNISRTEINWFCRNFQLPIWSDQTNYQYKISRNRIRYELIPYLNNYFSINIEKRINSFLKISNTDNDYIKQTTLKLYLYAHHQNLIAINYQVVQIQHFAIKQRMIQLFCYHHFNQILNKNLLYKILHVLSLHYKKNITRIFIWDEKRICITNKWIYIH
uniref:tRNA(Ile)-lysidine synthase n=1 Tax=Gayliella sp. TaxID=2575623 RepID=A0A4D6WWB4_9FLOR|nr:tRNA Ile-lysidine synthetase [Gayliella sp.]